MKKKNTSSLAALLLPLLMRIWSRIVLQMTLLISDVYILYLSYQCNAVSQEGKSSDKGLGSSVRSLGCFLSNSVFEYRIMHTKKRAVATEVLNITRHEQVSTK